MANFRALEYAKTGFRHKDRKYFGIVAFCLYSIGFVRFHIRRIAKW